MLGISLPLPVCEGSFSAIKQKLIRDGYSVNVAASQFRGEGMLGNEQNSSSHLDVQLNTWLSVWAIVYLWSKTAQYTVAEYKGSTNNINILHTKAY